MLFVFFFQAEDGIRDIGVTGVQTCALPIYVAIDESLQRRLPGAGHDVRFRSCHRAAHRLLLAVVSAGFDEVADSAIHDVSLRMPSEDFQLMLQLGRTQEIVGVEKLDELAGRGREAGVPGRRGSCRCLTQVDNPGIGSSQRCQDLSSPVVGPIIDDDAFPVRVTSPAKRLDRLPKAAAVVIGGDDHRDGHAAWPLFSPAAEARSEWSSAPVIGAGSLSLTKASAGWRRPSSAPPWSGDRELAASPAAARPERRPRPARGRPMIGAIRPPLLRFLRRTQLARPVPGPARGGNAPYLS